jgi:hypothetical protein
MYRKYDSAEQRAKEIGELAKQLDAIEVSSIVAGSTPAMGDVIVVVVANMWWWCEAVGMRWAWIQCPLDGWRRG